MKRALMIGVLAMTTGLLGCAGGGGSSGLVGSWRFSGAGGGTTVGDTVDVLQFRADNSYSSTTTSVNGDTGNNAGCHVTDTENGTYSVSSGSVTFTVTGGVLREVATDCTDSANNTTGADVTQAPYTRTFSVTGTTLTLNTASGARNYTMQ